MTMDEPLSRLTSGGFSIGIEAPLDNDRTHVDKNYGLLYRDSRTPELSPAYDIVAYAAYMSGKGHTLKFGPSSPKQPRLMPRVVRQFVYGCARPLGVQGQCRCPPD